MEAIGTDAGIASSYGAHGCPDKSANGMFSYAKDRGCDWGAIDTLPELPGVALRSDGHVGVYVGGGYAIEERGFNYGCVKTRVKDRNWTHWYKLPFIDYGEAGGAQPSQPAYALGSRLLKRGSAGADVKALQEHLLNLGYDLPAYGADGEFGAETEAAVKAFQTAEGLEADGKYGEKSHAALMDAVSDAQTGQDEGDAGQGEGESGAPAGPEEAQGAQVVIAGGTVNVRAGNGTNYRIITTVKAGSTFDHVATAHNGWQAIVINGQVGWVSPKYAEVIDD